MDPVSAIGVASAASTLLGNAITVVKYLQDFANAKKERAKWLGDLDGLMVLLNLLNVRSENAQKSSNPWYDGFLAATRKGGTLDSGIYNANGSIQPGGLLRELDKQLKELEQKLKPKDGWHGFMRRVMYTSDKDDFTARFRRLDGLRSYLHDILADDNFTLSEATYRTLDIRTGTIIKNQEFEKNRAEKKEEGKIIKWLSTLEFLERQRMIYSECFHHDSVPPGQWLLNSEEFVAWKSGSPWPLYCYGNPGAGKTVLSSVIVEHLMEHCKKQPTDEKMAVLCLYLNYKETEVQTIPNLISSLLKQLIQGRNFETLPERILMLYQYSEGEKRPAVDETLKILTSEISANFHRIYLVVDALDELPEDDRPEFLTILQHIEPEKVSLLVTSRAFDDIGHDKTISCGECGRDELALYHHCQTCPNFDLCQNCRSKGVSCKWDHDFEEPNLVVKDIKAPDDEIERFVKWSLNLQLGLGGDRFLDQRLDSGRIATTRLGKFCKSYPELMKDIPNAVVDKANGMFLLAKLHMDTLKVQSSAAAVKKALKSLSAEVSNVYNSILERIDKQRNDDDVILAKRALSWVVLAHRPLSVSELRQALAVESSDTEFDPAAQTELSILLTVTAGLVSADADRGAVRLVHKTAQEYFEANWKTLFPKAQTEIASTIITYLNFEPLSTPCEGNEEDVEVDSRLAEYSFFAYAATYWGKHMQEVLNEPETQTAVVTFLKDPLKLASTIQAAWYTGSKSSTSASWDVRAGVNSLHVCAWYGLDFAVDTLRDETPDLDIDSRDEKFGQTPLIYACRQGHVSTVSKLVDLGADVNVRSTQGSTAVFESILSNQPKVLEILLQKEPVGRFLDINAVHPGKLGRTALMLAALDGLEDALPRLLQRSGILVNTQDTQGYTALALATTTKHTPIVKKLLENGAEVDLVNENGATALMIAAEHGKDEVVDELLKHNADPHIRDHDGDTVVFRAVTNGHGSIVKAILEHGVDIHSTDKSGDTLLHAVCTCNKSLPGTVRLLVEKGLDVNARGRRKQTPLHDACRTGKLDIIRVLLDLRADKSLRDLSDRTPDVIARQHGHAEKLRIHRETPGTESSANPEIIPSNESLPLWSLAKLGYLDLVRTAIKKSNVDLSVRDPDTNNTALHWAILTTGRDHLDNPEILDILLAAGMSPNDVDDHKRTPLHLAAYLADDYATAALLKVNANIRAQDIWGRTPLATALSESNYYIAVLLLDAGASINTMRKDEIQATFFAAVELGNFKVVELLVQRGADVEARNGKNKTALQMAKASGSEEVLGLLRHVIYEPLPTQ